MEQKYLNIFSIRSHLTALTAAAFVFSGVFWSWQAQALTCEQEYLQQSEREFQILKDLVQFESKVSTLQKTPSSSSMSYQQKLKEKFEAAKLEIYDLSKKFQAVKNKDLGRDKSSENTNRNEAEKKQEARGDIKEVLVLKDPTSSYLINVIPLKDGRIVSVSKDRTLRIWTLNRDGSYNSTPLEGHRGAVYAIAELRDGRIISGSADHTLRIWTLNSDGTHRSVELMGHKGSIHAIKELKDGRIISGSSDKTIRVWTLKPDGTYSSIQLKGHTGNITSLAILEDGRIVSGSTDQTLRVWTLKPGLRIWPFNLGDSYSSIELRGHDHYVHDVTVLKDGRIASGSFDRTLRVWTLNPDGTHNSIRLHEHSEGVMSIVELKDGRIVSGSLDKTLRVWTLNPDGAYRSVELKGHSNTVFAVMELNSGQIVSGSSDNTIRIWEGEIIQAGGF